MRIAVKAWDCETGTAELWGQKASPWHPDNYVVASATIDAKTGEVDALYSSARPPDGWLGKVFGDARIIVGFNPKFDLMHALVNQPKNQEVFRLFLADGGLIWDCQLAEFLLGGQAQEHSMLSLNEVSVRYGGSLKHDEVAALWAQGVNTPDIPRDLLMRYLAGGENPKTGEFEPGDIQNTLTVFKGQWKRAHQMQMFPLLIMNMRAYAYTVLCKLWGMHVDLALGAQHTKELEDELAALRKQLDEHVSGLPFEFNWGSVKQRSALLFGGDIPYTATEYLGRSTSSFYKPDEDLWWCPERDGDKPPGWEQVYTPKVEKHYQRVSGGTISAAAWEEDTRTQHPDAPEVVRFKSGKNAGQPKTVSVSVPDLTKPKKRQCEVLHKMPRMVNPRAEWATSDPAVWSTASEVIEALENSGVKFLKLFAEWQKMQKDLGTYYQTTDKQGRPKGMLTLVAQATQLVHGELSMVTAITGRLAASRPNTQNLPRDGTSRVKQMFTSRWGPDGAILQDDFSSLEVYCQANLSKCAALLADLEKGLDLHCVRLSAWKELTYDEAYAMAKGPEATHEGKELRTHAKVFSFRRAYGAGAATISEGTGIPIEQVEELIEAENKRWPGIEPYYEELTKEIARNREPGGRFIPHPDKPTLMCQLGTSWARTPDGKLYTYREHPAPKWMLERKGGRSSTFSPTEIRNYVVQGAGAEVAKAAMAVLAYTWARDPELFYKAPLVNQVHDAFYADAHPDVKERAAATMHACVLEASTVIRRQLGWDLSIDYPAEIQWGPSMADEGPLPETVLAQVPAIRERIRATIKEIQ